MTHLTDNERAILNDAMDILMSKLTEGQYWDMTWNWTRGCKPSLSVLTATPLTNGFHHWLEGATFADKVDTGLEAIAEEARNYPSPEAQKARRIEELRAELAELGAGK